MDLYILIAALLLTLVWTALWGALPPIGVGYYAYLQGEKGAKEALAMRDEALKAVADVKALIIGWKLPPEAIEDLRKSITATLDGKMGRYIRDAGDAVEEEGKTNPLKVIMSLLK